MHKSPSIFSSYSKNYRRLVAAGVVLAIIICAYVIFALAIASKTPLHARVLGADISNLSTNEATQKLDRAIANSMSKPIKVSAEGKSAQIKGADLGLKLDSSQVIDDLVGFSLNPVHLWRHFFGSADIAVNPESDPKAQENVIKRVAKKLDREAVNASISFENAKPKLTPAVSGVKIDQDATLGKVTEAWGLGKSTVEAVFQKNKPDISDQDVQPALQSARQITTSALHFTAKQKNGTLTPAEIASATTFDVIEGALKINTDWQKLAQILENKVSGWKLKPQDAKIMIVSRSPKVTPAQAGFGIKSEDLKVAFEQALKASDRSSEVKVSTVEPQLTTDAAQKLGVKEIVGEFTTPHSAEVKRNRNLSLGAKHLTNVLLKPGEVFSLEKVLGPLSAERGFQDAGVTKNGIHTKALGGGLSQVCVTTLNAAFYAGLEIVEHRPHSNYIPRYPMGRDCTLWSGSLDLKIKNNTPYGVVFEGINETNRISVRVWSTKYWTVEDSLSPRQDIVPAKSVNNNSPECVPSNPGEPGFAVRVQRTIRHGDKVGKPINWLWRYRPDDGNVCTNSAAQKP